MKMMGAKDLSELGPRFVSIRPCHVLAESVLPLTSPTPRSTRAWWSGISSTATPGWTGQGCGRRPAPSCERIEMCLPRMRGAKIVLCFAACGGAVAAEVGCSTTCGKWWAADAGTADLEFRGFPGTCFGIHLGPFQNCPTADDWICRGSALDRSVAIILRISIIVAARWKRVRREGVIPLRIPRTHRHCFPLRLSCTGVV